MNKQFEILKSIQDNLLNEVSIDYKRYIFYKINWGDKLIGLIGERWVGKTTMMLQKLKEKHDGFYFSADNSIVKANGLFEFVYFLYENYDFNVFYIDEIHKYENWTNEIKNIYDSIPNSKVIFSGSSSLDLFKWILDLWRRANFYNIFPLNFSEFLKLFYNINVPSYSFEEILQNHKQISLDLSSEIKDKYFKEYISFWYYPFAKGISNSSFIQKIQILLDRIILEDLPVFLDFKNLSLDRLRKLFYFISNSSPSELSFTSLGKKINLNKNVVENAMFLLNKIWIIALIPKFWNLSDRIRKEYKILLWNPNLYLAYSIWVDIWILRESFFVSQIRKVQNTELFLPKKWDFIVNIFDKNYYFEIWWKNKTKSKYPKNTFIVKDNIKISENNYTIPLWLFGLIK